MNGDCQAWDCFKPATRRLVVALEVDGGGVKFSLLTCQGHGDALDDEPGTYLVTLSETA